MTGAEIVERPIITQETVPTQTEEEKIILVVEGKDVVEVEGVKDVVMVKPIIETITTVTRTWTRDSSHLKRTKHVLEK